MSTLRRLFFGCEVSAPWSDEYPKGRIIPPSSRHLTLAFLGNVDAGLLEEKIQEMPLPDVAIGPTGYFDECLLLPPGNPRVVAWHVRWYNEQNLGAYQKKITQWLIQSGYGVDQRDFLPHVSIARSPQHSDDWIKEFMPLPLMIKALHLYESIGNLIYTPVWSFPFRLPFVEVDHTADIAYLILGNNIQELHLNAMVALAFQFPEFLPYIKDVPLKDSLDDIVIALNQLITIIDCERGSPLKAVSFHGNIQRENGLLKWEMIVDV